MAIFNSYVKLPEGTVQKQIQLFDTCIGCGVLFCNRKVSCRPSLGAGNTIRICWQVFCSADSDWVNEPRSLGWQEISQLFSNGGRGSCDHSQMPTGTLSSAMPGKSEACCMLNRQVMTFCILFAHCFHLMWGLETLFMFIWYHYHWYHWISFDVICIAHGIGVAMLRPFKLEATGSGDGPSSRAFGFQDSSFLVRTFLAQSLSEMAMQMEAKPGSQHGKLMEAVWPTPNIPRHPMGGACWELRFPATYSLAAHPLARGELCWSSCQLPWSQAFHNTVMNQVDLLKTGFFGKIRSCMLLLAPRSY